MGTSRGKNWPGTVGRCPFSFEKIQATLVIGPPCHGDILATLNASVNKGVV